ncbi:MAG: Rpn family recombination-promoting nuclease/putative transposase [Pseudomonadota bacterium]
MSKLIHNPHDKTFRKAMSHPSVARDIFEQSLSEEVKQLIDFKEMHIEKDTFVDETYRYELSDLIYRVKLKNGGTGYIYLLCEHLSQAKPQMAFSLLSYQIKMMKAHLEKGYDKLPLVFPIVLYHGKAAYKEPTDIYACFEHPDLAHKYFLKPHGLIDLSKLEDEEILKYQWASVMELIFKHVFERDVLPVFEKLAESGIFDRIVEEGGSHYVLDMVYYTINAAEVSDPERFKKVFEQQQDIGERVMTIFQQFEHQKEQAMQQGMQQGIQQGKINHAYEMARRMLTDNESFEKIARYTGLSIEEIKTLR